LIKRGKNRHKNLLRLPYTKVRAQREAGVPSLVVFHNLNVSYVQKIDFCLHSDFGSTVGSNKSHLRQWTPLNRTYFAQVKCGEDQHFSYPSIDWYAPKTQDDNSRGFTKVRDQKARDHGAHSEVIAVSLYLRGHLIVINHE